MITIKWLEDVELEIVTSMNLKTDQPDLENITIKKDEVNEVDIIDERNVGADLQFGNGSMAFNVNKTWYKQIGFSKK